MKQSPSIFTFILFCLAFQMPDISVTAQSQEIFHRNDYTLIFYNEDSTLDLTTKERMVETFFKVYPAITKDYNPEAERQIVFYVDTAYTGVAEVDVAKAFVRFNPDWLHQYPEDVDVVTHEVMHMAQNYPSLTVGPWWLIEGIADYGRHVYGVNNECAGWSPSPYTDEQSYCDGYRVTANFLLWIEANIKPGLVSTLNKAMYAGAYSDLIWSTQTGMTVDELWQRYARYSSEVAVKKSLKN